MDVKNYRENEIKWFILAYMFLLTGIKRPDMIFVTNTDLLSKIESILSSTLLAGVICTLSFVFDCLYTTKFKEILLFLGFTKMPGKTVFTRISNGRLKDIRFETDKAQKHYKHIAKEIPSDKEKRCAFENEQWYLLFSKYKDDNMIKSSHRDFLLSRDLYVTTITLTVLTVIAMTFRIIQLNWIPIGYLTLMLILTNLSAHFKAHRFINNVIAVDLRNVI